MIKIAPLIRELARQPERFTHYLVHTGQHYDKSMSESFFSDLDIPPPDVNLGIGSGTHAEQVGRTMIAFEPVVREWRPDWIVVVGDVNATCASSITAKKELVRLAHIEAGLRSFDMTMPEEINRMVTDRLSDLLLTPDDIADTNLRNEGTPDSRIRRVGNIMIDTLEANRAAAEKLDVQGIVGTHLLSGRADDVLSGIESGYAVLTLHRPSNVDSREVLEPLVRFFIEEVAEELPLIWALHPRTRKQLEQSELWDTVCKSPHTFLVEPLGYREMLRLNIGARLMFTDSGGLQEECCVVGTPCITLRHNTERPVTLREHGGVSELAGNDVNRIRQVYQEMKSLPKATSRPPLWDGKTAERIVDCLEEVGTRA